MKADNEARFRSETEGGEIELTGTHKVILAVFGLAFLVMMYGVIPWEDMGVSLPTWWWWFPEMTGSFLLFAIVIGLIARMGEGSSRARSSTAPASSSGSRSSSGSPAGSR